MNYILKDKVPVKEPDILKWAKWIGERDNTIVIQTNLPGDILVSTVFLGIDHAFGDTEPILFETMVFGGEHSDYQERYHTWEEAEAGHQEAIDMIFKA